MKPNTVDCQNKLVMFFAQKKIDTKAEDWEVKKKYRGVVGSTVRDFINKKLDIIAIVACEKNQEYLNATGLEKDDIEEYNLIVRENMNGNAIMFEKNGQKYFGFTPFYNTKNTLIYTENLAKYLVSGELETNAAYQKQFFIKDLETFFKDGYYISNKEDDMLFIFPNQSPDEVCNKLFQAGWRVISDFYGLIESRNYLPYFCLNLPQNMTSRGKNLLSNLYETFKKDKEDSDKLDEMLGKIRILVDKKNSEDVGISFNFIKNFLAYISEDGFKSIEIYSWDSGRNIMLNRNYTLIELVSRERRKRDKFLNAI